MRHWIADVLDGIGRLLMSAALWLSRHDEKVHGEIYEVLRNRYPAR